MKDDSFETKVENIGVYASQKTISPFNTTNLPIYQIGEIRDNIFGGTTSSFITQLQLSQYNPAFGIASQEKENSGDPANITVIQENESVNSVYLDIPFFTNRNDRDGDGVIDAYDVDDNDVNSDSDGDGVSDAVERANGTDPLNPDTDGDGIPDKDDSCPTTAGTVEFNGCADSDGDGIADPYDKCPDVAGLAKFGGCPDTDGDGIEDAKDACPEEAGLRRFRGCPDTDGDGIADPKDKCPTVAGPADNEGCPNPTKEAIDALNELGATVQFELNKADLKDEAIDLLISVYDIMSKFGNTNFSIEGHTDTSGPKAFNQKLSEERAGKVKSHLVEKGVEESRLSTKGFGEDNPKASNDTRNGRITNRRVEFKVVE